MVNAIKRHRGKNTEEDRKKRPKVLFIFTLLLTVIVLAIVYFLLPNILGGKGNASSKIRQMRQLTLEIGKLETDLKKQEVEFSDLVKKYYEQTGEKFPELTALGLSREQKKVLEEKIKNQKDFSIKDLLNDILDKTDEISEIKKTIIKYEALLPKPHIAIEGENHYQIAMNFLINEKGISKEKAGEIVERTALFDPLMQGFRVWNLFSGNEYGTFVTQGDAPISPNELIRQAKKEIIDARDKAISEKERLAAEIKNLEKTRNNIKAEVKNLRKEKAELEKQNDYLSKQNEEMNGEIKRMMNSLYYLVDLEINLKKAGILKSVFLGSPKLKEISPEDFKQTIDLRETNTIEIFAGQFEHLEEIKEITLYPRFYKKDIDYKVTILETKHKAVLTISDVEKFKRERVVISVE